MLVLSRRIGDGILIGDEVEVLIHSVERGQIRVGINAPRGVSVRRAELESGEGGRGATAAGARARGARRRLKPTEAATAGSQRPAGGARNRRRVIIEAAPRSAPDDPESMGEPMLREAFQDTSAEVLDAVARGDAVDPGIRRALMELAREELVRRERDGDRARPEALA